MTGGARSGFFERDAFLAVRSRLPVDLQVAANIAYTYGWRMQSEVLMLNPSQLDLDAGRLRLEPGTTKNGVPHRESRGSSGRGAPAHGHIFGHSGPGDDRRSLDSRSISL